MSQHVNSISDTRPCKQTSINQGRIAGATVQRSDVLMSGGTRSWIPARFASTAWSSPASQSQQIPVHSLSITAGIPSIHMPYSTPVLFMLIVSGHQGGWKNIVSHSTYKLRRQLKQELQPLPQPTLIYPHISMQPLSETKLNEFNVFAAIIYN